MTEPVRASVHGFPRIGPRRELKSAVEGFWGGRVSAEDLAATASRIRRNGWTAMAAAGIDLVPCNDFSLYDHVLDTAVLVDAVPVRYRGVAGDLAAYFAMARGLPGGAGGPDLAPMAMTKWFDTNYHFIVPELGPDTDFRLFGSKPFDELAEARAVAGAVKPVLIGPVSFLLLSRPEPGMEHFEPLSLLDGLLEVYGEVLARLAEGGAAWVQLDEPVFAADRSPAELAALQRACAHLGGLSHRPALVVSTYFGHPGDALGIIADSPVEGVGLDLVAGPEGLGLLEAAHPVMADKAVFAGVVDGRNVWANDLGRSLELLRRVSDLAGQVVVSTSCSLLHVPVSLAGEDRLEEGLRTRLAFATEKLDEVGLLARALEAGPEVITDALAERRPPERRSAPAGSPPTTTAPDGAWTRPPAERRRQVQHDALGLPLLPTTTLGSFPQTADLRAARASLAAGRMGPADYEARMRAEIEAVVGLQERLGLDVVVHGEPERNDMVQYFAEQLDGFAATETGWVQSYGTRCVRPPIIHADVGRRDPMAVEWWRFASSLTDRPVKAMLTGPVTMVLWSFPRVDQPRGQTARQVALALRAEIADLEQAGAAIIQVDEPAFREGLPLRVADRPGYLAWAVDAFRTATGGAGAATQVHTHMCYSDFADILDAVAALDADVVSFEAARSSMELLAPLEGSGLASEIGPGIYDVHSPRVPSVEELVALLGRAAEAVGAGRLWVNPDCGLKTRSYAEVEPALGHLVEAARILRAGRAGHQG